jgi:hypothetical protein
MGLDMYLQRKQRLTSKEYNDESSHLYWRKANAIHYYFVSNGAFIEDAEDAKEEYGPYEVSREQLYKLVDICSEILQSNEVCEEEMSSYDFEKGEFINEIKTFSINKELANTNLPTQGGFFFGNTDYGYEYYSDLTYTIKVLLRELEMFPDQEVWYYWASW